MRLLYLVSPLIGFFVFMLGVIHQVPCHGQIRGDQLGVSQGHRYVPMPHPRLHDFNINSTAKESGGTGMSAMVENKPAQR